MKCTIPGVNARILAKAMHSFARIGSDLFIEAQPHGLSIRTVNRTKSAFAMILFHPDFFTNYDMSVDSADAVDDDGDDFANKCKISAKSCLNVFKNMRQVEQLRISMDTARYKLKFEFDCRLEMMKTHHVSMLEQESLQAVFPTEGMPNALQAGHRLFDEIVGNFQANEEELTLDASAAELMVKNFVEGATVDRRYMRSQMAIKPDEFERYAIGAETSITFSLRELRAILNFADALSLDVSVNFETAGLPVVFSLRNSDTFETNLVMSTLASDHYNETLYNQSAAAAPPPAQRKTRKQMRPNETAESVNISTVNDTYSSNSNRNDDTAMDTTTTDATPSPALFQFNRPADRSTRACTTRADHRNTLARDLHASGSSIAVPVPVDYDRTQLSAVGRLASPSPQHRTVASLPTTVESDSTSLLGSDDVFLEFCEDSEEPRPKPAGAADGVAPAAAHDDDVDEIPMSPPPAEQSGRSKRRKLMKVFKTCFEATYDPRTAPGASQVLAYESDDDEKM